jgi:hypothetical protein
MVRREENDLNLLPYQIRNKSDIDCEKCNILGNRLLIVQEELKTSRLIIELLLEDVDSPGEKNPGTERDNIQGLQIPLKDTNWLHVQDNPHKKKTPEQKHLSEIYLKTENRFAALSNLTNSTGQSEIKNVLRENIAKSTCQANFVERNIEEKDQIKIYYYCNSEWFNNIQYQGSAKEYG